MSAQFFKVETRIENGEFSVKKPTTNARSPRLSTEVKHPKTKQGVALDRIRYIMRHLSARIPSKPGMEDAYVATRINVNAAMRECGLSNGEIAKYRAIMQNMGLLRYSGNTWYVLRASMVGRFATVRWFKLAHKEWLECAARDKENADLRKQLSRMLEEPSAGPEERPNASTQSDDVVNQVLAELLMRTRAENAALQAKADKLEKELAVQLAALDAAQQENKELQQWPNGTKRDEYVRTHVPIAQYQ